jgi:hypothetical protein
LRRLSILTRCRFSAPIGYSLQEAVSVSDKCASHFVPRATPLCINGDVVPRDFKLLCFIPAYTWHARDVAQFCTQDMFAAH